jgi:hypothetical protein
VLAGPSFVDGAVVVVNTVAASFYSAVDGAAVVVAEEDVGGVAAGVAAYAWVGSGLLLVCLPDIIPWTMAPGA